MDVNNANKKEKGVKNEEEEGRRKKEEHRREGKMNEKEKEK